MARVLCLFNRAALHRFCIFDFRAVLICVYIVVILVCAPKYKLFGHSAPPLFNLPIPRAVSLLKRPKNRIVKRSRSFLCNLLLELQL